jgi:hypothetical protein
MLDRSRLTRLIMCALASCAVTWALAVTAPAMPASDPAGTTAAPAFKDVPGDAGKAPVAPPAADTVADTDKVPDPAQVQRVLNGINARTAQPAASAPDTNDDTGTVALVLAAAAMLIAGAAVALTLTRPRPRPRPRRPMLGA